MCAWALIPPGLKISLINKPLVNLQKVRPIAHIWLRGYGSKEDIPERYTDLNKKKKKKLNIILKLFSESLNKIYYLGKIKCVVSKLPEFVKAY